MFLQILTYFKHENEGANNCTLHAYFKYEYKLHHTMI